MKVLRLMGLTVLFLLLCLFVWAEAPLEHPALEGRQVVAWQAVGDSGWGFASVKDGDHNFLIAFEKGAHGWEERFSSGRALPRGPMRFLLQDVSGAYRTVVEGENFIFDRDKWGPALMVYWSNGEFYENQFIYELSKDGRWLLSHYAHAGQSGLVDITDDELVFYEAYTGVQRVKVKTERDLRQFTYFAFPRTPRRAVQPELVPPELPLGWQGVPEIPLVGEELIPVYTAPDKGSLRAAGGKAAVSPKGWAQVLGVEGDFALIQYGVSRNRYRIGYVESRFLPDWYLKEGLGFTRVPAEVLRAVKASDDPLGGQELLAALSPGQKVTLLSGFGELAYFEAEENGKTYRAFTTLSAFDRAPEPSKPTREMAFFLEGQSQRGVFTRIREEALGLEIWADLEHFEVEAQWNGFAFILKDNQLSSPVHLFVFRGLKEEAVMKEALGAQLAVYREEGFAVREHAYLGELGGLNLQQTPEVSIGRKDGAVARAYFAQTALADYVAILEYPEEAAEGWGARMDYMLGTLTELPPP